MSEIAKILELRNINKSFPGVKALDKVDFSVIAGEVHALLGENGAGKSTLMKILGGIFPCDSGEIIINNKLVNLSSPADAKKEGVILIHQELSLAPELSVAENIFLGELSTKRFGFVDWKTLFAKTNAILKKLNCDFEATTLVSDLNIAKKQMVEIARALTFKSKVVVFDEPTSSLTDQEKGVLFDVIQGLQVDNVGVVYISHRMEEIFHISDRISILRDGEYRGTLITKNTNENKVTQLMIGRDLNYTKTTNQKKSKTAILEVNNISCGDHFKNVSFNVYPGEVLGFYGLMGAGRTEIMQALYGLRDLDEGEIIVDGKKIINNSPKTAIDMGISLIPENRQEQGLILGMNCKENITLPKLKDLTSYFIVKEKEEIDIHDYYHKKIDIRSSGWQQTVGTLSGGNQQKIVLSKWLAMKPKVLIVDEPTKGIDVGSKAEIHKLLRELSTNGYGVIVISSEMSEMLNVSDRIIAMHRGRISKEFTLEEITEDNLMRAISGLELNSKV